MSNKINIADVSLSDLDLDFPVSSIMAYHEPFMEVVGDKLVVGYLADDEHCEDPFVSCDMLGGFHSLIGRQRNLSGEAKEALCLDYHDEPDTEYLNSNPDFDPHIKPLWVNAAAQDHEFKEWAVSTKAESSHPFSDSEAYYKLRAIDVWEASAVPSYDADRVTVHSFSECHNDVLLKAWQDLRMKKLIGDPDLVFLDVYEHGGQHWSVSGGDGQCGFDTSCKAGIWVPGNSELREVLEKRALAYSFGSLTKDINQKYIVQLNPVEGPDKNDPGHSFDSWGPAFSFLKAKAAIQFQTPKGKLVAARRHHEARNVAAEELAGEALETFNAWLAGSCYATVVATFDIAFDEDGELEFTLSDSDECWGYIGDEYAATELASAFQCVTEHLAQKKAA